MEKEKIRQESYWIDLFSNERLENPVKNALKSNALFKDLNLSELRYLERIVHIRKYETGEFVFQQNETGIGMYIIAKGKIEIRVASTGKQSGEDLLIATLPEESFFGEQALIESDLKRAASAVVAEPSILVAFLKPDLLNIIQRRPSLGIKITMQLATVLGKRLKRTTEKLSEYAAESHDS